MAICQLARLMMSQNRYSDFCVFNNAEAQKPGKKSSFYMQENKGPSHHKRKMLTMLTFSHRLC